MKVMAVSDLHGNFEGIDPSDADLVVIPGDFAPIKGWSFWQIRDQVKWVNKTFCTWCASHSNVEFCVIPGNHDLFAKHQELLSCVSWPSNVRFLMDREETVCGLRIAGSPWIPPISGRWAFETAGEAELEQRFGWLPEGLDILITHSPPFVDGSCIDLSLQTMSQHFGSLALTAAIHRVKPRFHFCGHIHTGYHEPLDIVHEVGTKTICRNVSRLDERYEVAFDPAIIEIDASLK